MNRTSTSQFGFFNLRVLIGLFVVAAGVCLALAGLGAFSSSAASAAPARQDNAGFNGVDISLLPPGLDCARIHDLGYDKMENFRAGLVLKACGVGAGEEDSASSAHAASRLVQSLLPSSPLFIGGADVDVVLPDGSYPKVTQSESMIWGGLNNTWVVNYNDSRTSSGCYSGLSYSTDNGVTWHRGQPLCSGHGTNFGDPIVVYNAALGMWFAGDLASGCGGQGIGLWTSPNGVTWSPGACAYNTSQGDRESMWVDNNPASPHYGRMYISLNDYAIGGGALRVVYSDNGTTWTAVTLNGAFIRDVQITGDLGGSGRVYVASMNEMGGGLSTRQNTVYRSTNGGVTWASSNTGPTFAAPGRSACTANTYFVCMFGTNSWRHMGWGEPAANGNFVSLTYAQHGSGADLGNVYFVRSTDAGVTWGTPVKLNTDSGTALQWQPSLAGTNSGALFASWYDQREVNSGADLNCTAGSPTQQCYRRWGRRSFDNGATWLPDDMVGRATSPLPGQPDSAVQPNYQGDYDYHSANGQLIGGSWTDGRVIISNASQQDVFVNFVQAGFGVIGADPVAPAISNQAVDPSGTKISLTEGNLIESQPIGGTNCVACSTCSDPQTFNSTHCISFTMSYNSRDADGSRAQLSTVMGLGWTHSFNIFLFSQAGSIFRFDGNGRVTKYLHNANDTYTADTGYFETLVRQSSTTFVLTQKDQTRFTFTVVPGTLFTVGDTVVYRLTEIRDRNNDTVTLTYSGADLLSVADTYGRTINFTYDAHHNVASMTDPLTRTTMFTYDPAGTHLMSITDPLGRTVMYTYNGLNQLTSKTDKDGRLFTYSYANNKPTASTDGIGLNFSLSNPNNWAIDQNALNTTQLLVYLPSTTTLTDGRNNHWSYQYDSRGYVTNMTAPDNALTTYTYDSATRRVASITDANNHTTQYQYDSQGNRTRITLPAPFNYVTMFTYEPTFNMMTSVTDPKGRVTTYSYDSQGNRTMETDPLLQTRHWTYDAHGNILTETDKRGNTTTYAYDTAGNRTSITAPPPLGYVTTMIYDNVGNLTSRTDPNNHTTTYQYDGLNRLIRQTDPAGHFDQYGYDNQGHRIQVIDRNGHPTLFQYDQRGRLIRMTDALSHFETYGYDANNNRISLTDKNGHTTTYQYDVQNRLVMTTDAAGNVVSRTYDPVGNMTSKTDANLHTTNYTFDALNRTSTVTDALGYVTAYEYDMGGSTGCGTCGVTPGTSLITKKTDGNGKVTYFRYDDLDRRTLMIRKEGDVDPDPDPSDAVTGYTYDPNNNRLTMTEPDGNITTYQYDVLNRRTNETNAAGDVTQMTYDGASNVITTTAPNGNVTTNTYDTRDRLIQVDDSIGRVTNYTYDNAGNRLSQTDGDNNTTSYSYDAIDRQTGVTDPLSQTSTIQYDSVGNVLMIIDREGNMTTRVYDNINRRTSTTDALNHTTQFQYDGVGNLRFITDANTHVTEYRYDNINRRVMEIYADPPPNTRTFTYDAVNMISRTDQRGETTNYVYNDLYFLLHRTYPVGPADNMTYDLSGRMLTAERGGWVVSYAYDGANRVTQTVQNGKTVGYSYNIPGRTRMLTYPGGRQITEHTDARSRLDHIDDAGSPPPIAQYSYDLGNRVGTRTYRNGTVATYTYNANDWTTSLEHMFGATRIAGFGYDFDNEGNKQFEEKRHDPNHSEHYQYDDIYRLMDYKVAPLPTECTNCAPTPIITQTAYNLDAVGNWNSKTTDGVTQTRMHNAVNELTMIDATNLIYDDNGNLQNDGTYTYGYDEENRLTQVTRNSDNAVVGQYRYDALGRRVKKIANPAGTAIETRYFYDDARIIEEQSNIGVTLATYVYGNYVDEVLSMERGGQTVFYHQNNVWSVEAITNATGGTIERYSYDAYGQPRVFDGSGTPIPPNPWGTPHSAIGNSYLFTGRQLDEETGFYFYRARYYDANKGRFLQRDPLGYEDGLNLYEYVRSNPLNHTDPSGRQEISIKTKSGPTPGNCGEFSWTIQWILDKESAKGGYLIQAIDFEGEVTDCDGNKVIYCGSDKGKFWEAWQFNKGKKVTTYAEKGDEDDDTYKCPGIVCTKTGGFSILGKATFYEDLTLPAEFKKNNPATNAGILPSTTTDPKLKGGSKTVDHNITVKWNCCPKGHIEKTTIVKTVP